MAIGYDHHRNQQPLDVNVVGGTIGTTDTYFTSLNTAIGDLVISPTTTEIKVGVSRLPNRKQIYILNDASCLVYISFDNPIILASRDYLVLLSGEELKLDLDPTLDEPIYIRTDEVTTNIRIVEVN